MQMIRFLLLRRFAFDFSEFSQHLDDLIHHAPTFINVSIFSTAEGYGNLHLVVMLQKCNCLFDFEFDVMLPSFGSQPNFLELGVRQTGGFASGATSTRSSPACRARVNASLVSRTPN